MPDQSVTIGIALVLTAVALIAVGANVQRLALKTIPREPLRSVVWFAGLSIYFTANVLYTFGLVYAPASLCATLMAAIIPINALTSRIIIGEVLQLVDGQGGVLITLGITLAAWAAPYTNESYTADDLKILFVTPNSIMLLSALCGTIIVLATITLCHEHKKRTAVAPAPASSSPVRHYAPSAAPSASAPSSCLAASMPFAYPIVVGLLESLVQIAQKGGSSMVALTAAGNSQLEAPTFWCFIAVWVLTSLAVVWWLRKGLANLAANRMLPIEYGTFTAVSVLAGLVCYDEARYVSQRHRMLMAGGVLLVILGCALVGSRRALRLKCCGASCTSEEEEAAVQHASRVRGVLHERLLPANGLRSDGRTAKNPFVKPSA